MAPAYIANAVMLLFIVLKLFNIDVPVTSEDVQNALTTLLVVVVPIFTMIRQLSTGRLTIFGFRPAR